jgi:glutaminyl-tRNA synthetase
MCLSDLFLYVTIQIKSPAQLDAALSFLSNVGPEYLDIGKFEEACGVGMLLQ